VIVTPSAVSVNYSTADGTAKAGSDYLASAGTLVFAAGETSKTITVQVKGDRIDELDESFFVNLTDATNATISDSQGVGIITDNDAPPNITIGDRTLVEGNDGTVSMVFTVTLDSASELPVSVNYATADGTAKAGSDYIASAGTLVFAAGETTKTITVQVKGDRIDELDENFFVNLTGATNGAIADSQAVGIITDNDVPPNIAIGDRTIVEGNDGTLNMVFTVTLDSASELPVSVNYSTADGTAKAGSDYLAAAGTLTFAAGETTKTITVQVKGDRIDELDENFFVNLTGATNGAIADAQAVGTITDNDVPPQITIGDRTLVEGNDGTLSMVFTVTLDSASELPVSVNYSTADGTAQAGSDYVAAAGTITFAAGETSKTITVQVKGDRIDELDENFFVNLTGATNGAIADSQAVGIITDNDVPPQITIGDRTLIEGNDGTLNMVFTVTLDSASELPVSVNYSTADGAAKAGNDYLAAAGTLTFAAGETTKTITVQVKGDRIDEADETFFVNLSGATNAAIADSQAVGTIIDNDAAPTLVISVNPPELWPPNHKMVEIKPAFTVSDDFDTNPRVELVSITSNEPDNGLGDGDTAKDIEIRSDGRIFLRAERSGTGNGRVYTLTYKATDSDGNVTYATALVKVPKSR
jgi:hypothetical protein